jgi:hypothetical protein
VYLYTHNGYCYNSPYPNSEATHIQRAVAFIGCSSTAARTSHTALNVSAGGLIYLTQ